MRVSKEKAAQNRQHILTAAARLFREQGVSATGVDAITKDVSLTHGAVYSHFGSKGAIAAEAIRLALQGSRRLWQRLAERKGAKKAFDCCAASVKLTLPERTVQNLVRKAKALGYNLLPTTDAASPDALA